MKLKKLIKMSQVQHERDYFSHITQWINRIFCIPIRDISCQNIQESAEEQVKLDEEVIIIEKNAIQNSSMPLHKYASMTRENISNEKGFSLN